MTSTPQQSYTETIWGSGSVSSPSSSSAKKSVSQSPKASPALFVDVLNRHGRPSSPSSPASVSPLPRNSNNIRLSPTGPQMLQFVDPLAGDSDDAGTDLESSREHRMVLHESPNRTNKYLSNYNSPAAAANVNDRDRLISSIRFETLSNISVPPYNEKKPTYPPLKPNYQAFLSREEDDRLSKTPLKTKSSPGKIISKASARTPGKTPSKMTPSRTHPHNYAPKEKSKLATFTVPEQDGRYMSGDPLDVSFARNSPDPFRSSTPFKSNNPFLNRASSSASPRKSPFKSSPFKNSRYGNEEAADSDDENENEDQNNTNGEGHEDGDYSGEHGFYNRFKRNHNSNKKPPKIQANYYVTRGQSWLNPDTPIIVEAYLRVAFNLAMMGLLIWCIYMFLSTIRHDIEQRVEEYSADVLAEIAMCSREYLRNNCQPGRRVPYLEAMCNNWQKCMNQDPKVIGRAKVSAETFGDIINSFLKPIGFKAMAFVTMLFVGSLFVVNFVFAYKPPMKSVRNEAAVNGTSSSEQPSGQRSSTQTSTESNPMQTPAHQQQQHQPPLSIQYQQAAPHTPLYQGPPPSQPPPPHTPLYQGPPPSQPPPPHTPLYQAPQPPQPPPSQPTYSQPAPSFPYQNSTPYAEHYSTPQQQPQPASAFYTTTPGLSPLKR